MASKYIILVTGASSGFGKITATMLAQSGHFVYGTSRKDITNSPPGVRMLKMDTAVAESIQLAVDVIINEHGRLDVLINNAGGGISGAIELTTKEEVEWQMRTNFMSVVNVSHAVLPIMRLARSGKIINISSIGGVIAVPFQGFYSASKYAIEGYSEALANEVRRFGIRICVVEPGDCRTNFTANRNVSPATLLHEDYKKDFERTMQVVEHTETAGSDPMKVGRVICGLVRSYNPRFRTKVGPWGQVLFARCRRLLPDSMVQRIVRLFYNIG